MGIFDVFKKTRQLPKSSIRPYVLLVLDGWGLAPPGEGNAMYKAKTPNMDSYFANYPHGELIASGESVGLPANEVGNTEVGHLTMGAGRAMSQDLARINNSLTDGTFYDNRALTHAIAHAVRGKSRLHVMGLVGSGNVHSSMEHLYAILQFCKKSDFSEVYLHLFTDGRDSPPKSGAAIVEQIEQRLAALKIGRIATVSGRYYAMDRDRRWERTRRAYEAIVLAQGAQFSSAKDAVAQAYAKGQSDEFVDPSVIVGANGPVATVDNNDAVIIYNFRIDRPKQLAMSFILPNFETLTAQDFGYEGKRHRHEDELEVGKTFKRERVPSNLYFVTMTEYQKSLPVSEIAFPPEEVTASLAQVLSERGLAQVHMAESEKERFVTYYFDGLREKPFPNTLVDITPSPKVATYDKEPEMSVFEIVKRFKEHLSESKYNFFVMNFANADMVAHSGNVPATIAAIEHLDKAIGEVAALVEASGGVLFITADHGNAEDLLSFPESSYFYTSEKGAVNTDHSNHPVPFIVLSSNLKGNARVLTRGTLADVAPTVLASMGLSIPPVMTGRNLLE